MPSDLEKYFNGAGVIDFLEISEAEQTLKQSVEFVYRFYSKDKVFSSTVQTNHALATEAVIDKIGDSVDLFRTHVIPFAHKNSFDVNAFIVALVCDELLVQANSSIRDDDGNIKSIRDDFDPSLYKRAAIILETSNNFRESMTTGPVSNEAFMLSQINSLRDLGSIMEDMRTYEGFDEAYEDFRNSLNWLNALSSAQTSLSPLIRQRMFEAMDMVGMSADQLKNMDYHAIHVPEPANDPW